jgi:hypothetical protein
VDTESSSRVNFSVVIRPAVNLRLGPFRRERERTHVFFYRHIPHISRQDDGRDAIMGVGTVPRSMQAVPSDTQKLAHIGRTAPRTHSFCFLKNSFSAAVSVLFQHEPCGDSQE